MLIMGIVSSSQPVSYNFRRLTPNDGLSDGAVHAIVQDKYGFTWIGTSYGLNRFDGVNIKTYFSKRTDNTSLGNNQVLSLHTDSKGDLWIGTYNGLCRYDYPSDRFINYLSAQEISVYDIHEDKAGSIWLATNYGLWKTNAQKLSIEKYTNDDTVFQKKFYCVIRKIVESPGGILYLATNCGIKIFDPISRIYDEIRFDPLKKYSISSDVVPSIALDSTGNLWAACVTPRSLLNKIDLKNKTVKTYDYFITAKKDWKYNTLQDILTDKNGRVWIISSGAGLSLYNEKEESFNDHGNNPFLPNSLLSNHNYTLYQDNTGIIWVGSLAYGVSYFNPDNTLFYTIHPTLDKKSSLPGDWCRAACEDSQGNLWLGTGSGLAVYDRRRNQFKVYANESGKKPILHINSIRSMLEDDGDIWIGTAGGLNRYRASTGVIEFFDERQGIPVTFFWMMGKGKNEEIWLGSVAGLFRYIRSMNRFDNLKNDPALAPYAGINVQALYIDSKNRLWAGLLNKGILMYDPSSKETRLLTIKAREISDTRTSSFAEDKKGIIWIGSEEGLVAYDPVNRKSRIYTRDEGLPSDRTNNLMVDDLNRLWIGTANGLCVLDSGRKIFRKFGVNDGLLTNQFNSQSAYRTKDGFFVYPMFAGFLLFRPEAFREDHSAIPVYITAFRVDRKKIKTDGNMESLQKIHLLHDQNFFSIELAGLNYINPSQCTYVYKLDGFDKDWIQTKKRDISYTNVPAGDYIFRYKVKPENSTIDAVEKTLQVSIDTVFYKTRWFQSLVVLLIISMLTGFYLYRMNHREKIYQLQGKAQTLEKEKAVVQYENLKQQLNPHFLFNSLTSLKSLIRINKNDAVHFLDNISLTYRYILKSSDSELVSLQNEIDFIQVYIDLQKTRFGDGLRVQTRIDEESLDKKIVPVTLQNLLENAIKHNLVDRERPLTIEIFTENSHITVRNNLQRKEFVETSNQYGLKSLQTLYRYLDKRPVQVEEDENYFTVKIPLI